MASPNTGKTYAVRAPVDRASGKDTSRESLWVTIGRAWAREDGSISIDILATPMAGRWSGALFLIPETPRQYQPGDAYRPRPLPGDPGDDVPF